PSACPEYWPDRLFPALQIAALRSPHIPPPARSGDSPTYCVRESPLELACAPGRRQCAENSGWVIISKFYSWHKLAHDIVFFGCDESATQFCLVLPHSFSFPLAFSLDSPSGLRRWWLAGEGSRASGDCRSISPLGRPSPRPQCASAQRSIAHLSFGGGLRVGGTVRRSHRRVSPLHAAARGGSCAQGARRVRGQAARGDSCAIYRTAVPP